MKQLLMICAMFAVLGNAHAQTESDALYANKQAMKGSGDDNMPMSKSNEFEHTEITTEKGRITFTGLPEEKKPIWAMITTADGEAVKGVKVSPAANVIDLGRMPAGMYFVTLVYKNASKKAFVLHM